MNNFAIDFKTSSGDQWHRWTVTATKEQAIQVCEYLDKKKCVTDTAIYKTADAASPQWQLAAKLKIA